MFSARKSAALCLSLSVSLSSCVSTSPKDRLPSSAKEYQQINRCGELGFSETTYVARDMDDVYYSLNLDCNGDRQVNAQDKQKAISIPLDQLSSQQKSWITRWTKAAQRHSKNLQAKPFICAELVVTDDPCVTGQNVLGYKPRLTSKIK